MRIVGTGLVACIVLLLCASLLADQPKTLKELRRHQLKGIGGIRVWVPPMQLGSEKEAKRIQTKSELRLRQTGINVGPEERAMLILNCAFLQKRGVLLRNLQVEISETGSFPRKGIVITDFPVTTWEYSMAGIDPVDSVDWEACTESVLDGVDEFLNDYLAANPPKKPEADPAHSQQPTPQP